MSVAVDHDAHSQADNDDVRRLLKDAASAFARKGGLARSRALRQTEPGFDRGMWAQMAEQGWLGLLIDEEFGGQGLGFSEMAVVVEELARTVSPEPVTASAVYASVVLAGSDNADLKKELLGKIAAGEVIIGVAGPDRLNDAGSIGVTVKGGALSGLTGNVYPALGADGFIIAAKDGVDVAIYYVDAKATGLSVAGKTRADGTTGGVLTLKDVKASALVAKGAGAVAALRRGSDAAVIMTCAELFGTMNEALDLTLEYMRTRVQFGKAIGSYQALQHRAVDLWLQKELSMGALADAVRVLDDPKSTPDQISMAASRVKSRCGDAAHMLGRETIKLHGAIGFTDEYDVGLFLRRAMALNAWLGNPSDHRRRVSSLLRSVGDVSAKKRDSVPFDPIFLSDEKSDIDWNSFSDDEFRAGVFAWFDKNYPKNMRNTGRRGSANEMRPWMKIISKKGWIAPAWPTKWGGMGLSPAKQIIYIEERERVGVMREPDMGLVMFGPMLMRWGTEEQKQKYLPRIVAYEDVWCQGYSEPNAGSDLASLQTSAVLDGDDYVINGSKIWTTSGHWADHMFLLARTDKNAKKQEGITFFVTPMSAPGLSVREIPNISGHSEFAQEFLENVRIPKENVVGEVNKGWTVAKSLLGFERLNSGSPRPARAALSAAEKVAKANGVWDDAEFQSKYTRVYLDIADLSTAYKRFADIMSLGDSPGPELSQLKIIVAGATQLASELLMETAGSAGANSDYESYDGDDVSLLGMFFNHFGAMIASGTNDIQRNIIAKRVLNLPG